MNRSTRFFILIALVPLGTLCSEKNSASYDITRRQSRCDSDTHTYQAEVYIVSSKEWTTVVSHVATLYKDTEIVINQSYQGYTVSTTASTNSSESKPEESFAKLKMEWEKRAAKSSLAEMRDKIFRRNSR